MCHRPPVSFWEPDFFAAYTVGRWLDNRGNKYVVAEEILAFTVVGFLLFGIFVIHGAAEAYTCVVGFACHGVEVWENGVA